MDINQLYTAETHEKGAKMQVRDQSGAPLDCYLILAGIDSKVWRKELKKAALLAASDSEIDEIDLTAESLAAITLGWEGFESKGKALTFSKKKAKELYLNAPYIQRQVDNFISDRGNFTVG